MVFALGAKVSIGIMIHFLLCIEGKMRKGDRQIGRQTGGERERERDTHTQRYK